MLKKLLVLALVCPIVADATCLSDDTLERVEFVRVMLAEELSGYTDAANEIETLSDYNAPVVAELVKRVATFIVEYDIVAQGISSCAINSTELLLAVEQAREEIQDDVRSASELGYQAPDDQR